MMIQIHSQGLAKGPNRFYGLAKGAAPHTNNVLWLSDSLQFSLTGCEGTVRPNVAEGFSLPFRGDLKVAPTCLSTNWRFPDNQKKFL